MVETIAVAAAALLIPGSFVVIGVLIRMMWKDLVAKIAEINGSVKATDNKLNRHMLYAADNYVKEDDCGVHRKECPARKEAMT